MSNQDVSVKLCTFCKNGGFVIECTSCRKCCHPSCRKSQPKSANHRNWTCPECTLSANSEKRANNPHTLTRWLSSRDKLKEHFAKFLRPEMTFMNLSQILSSGMQTTSSSNFHCPQEYIRDFVGPLDDSLADPKAGKAGNLRKNDKNKKKCRIVQMPANSSFVPEQKLSCHYCGRNCKTGPIILCDYCSLVFHLHCLDCAGLTVKKTEKWMCPLHVDHLVNEVFPTQSLTRRAACIKEFAACPVDEEKLARRFIDMQSNTVHRPISVSPTTVPRVVKYLYGKSKRMISADIGGVEEVVPSYVDMEEDRMARICHTKLMRGEVGVNHQGGLTGGENVVSTRAVAYLLYFESPSVLGRFFPIESNISIGTDDNCTVRLDRLFPSCQRKSRVHAHIFHDSDSKSFELINYSQYGTFVDDVIYSNAAEGESFPQRCACTPSDDCDLSGEGNEESAVLMHGSAISIGCGRFIFAVPSSI